MAFEKLGHIMLDDVRMKASDIYKMSIKKQNKQDYNPPAYNENKINIRSVFEKGGMCFYVTPKTQNAKKVKEYFFYLHGGGFVSQISHNEWRFVLDTVESTGHGAVVPN